MKTAYKILAAFAALLLLAPASRAQSDPNHEKYDSFPEAGVGLSKYLTSSEPDDNGVYTLRLETFTTGNVSLFAIPTDFVLVLDCSGSMLEDCLYGKTRPYYLTKAQTEDENDPYYQFLRPAHAPENIFQGISHYSYDHGFNAGDIGETVRLSGGAMNGYRYGGTQWSYFSATNTGAYPSLYYYFEPDATYYRIRREKVNGYCRLFFNRVNNERRYVVCTQSGTTVTTGTTTTPPEGTDNDSNDKILLVGYEGDNVFRPVSRVDELIPGFKSFIQSIYEHNTQDSFADGVVRHQVSIVAFGEGYTSGEAGSKANPSITPSTSTGSGTRVVKGFTEIGASNVNDFKNVIDDYFGFRGGTYTFLGIRLARRLLEDLQTQPNMEPLNGAGGTNRNKVVVVFTDGAPKALAANGNVGGGNIFNNVKLCLDDARVIKEVGDFPSDGKINGKVFSIDFADTGDASNFLRYLSSNYPDSEATGGPDLGQITYSGSPLPTEEDRIYYLDANTSGGLEKAFDAIANASTGDTGAHFVVVDVISNSFDFPSGITPESDKIKLYTAQCVGTKVIDGQTYLAFTDKVPVGSRPALDEIWFNSEDDEGDIVWDKKEGLKIDEGVKCVIDTTHKKLILKGFDFANLWCGLDGIPEHHNTRQIGPGDLNYDHQVDGYRGFKLIAEFPIVVDEGAIGGASVPTNEIGISGLFKADDEGNPEGNAIASYSSPSTSVPVHLTIQKSGLKPGESASITIQRRRAVAGSTYEDFTTLVLTGTADGEADPSVSVINLDPDYYYRVKENGWSWAYDRDPSMPSTENPTLRNPIVISNTAKATTLKHAEAIVSNHLKSN